MKYIFVINNKAGNKNNKPLIETQLKLIQNNSRQEYDYELYLTKGPEDAMRFVKQYCLDHLNDETCFVACGGDGTLHEVAQGLVNAPNKHLALFTCGSGNDFAKYYKSKNFNNLEKLFSGEKIKIDIIKVNDRYSINVCNFGFEAAVADYANQIKAKGGKNSYTKGIIKAIFTSMKNAIDVYADGKKINNGEMLLCTIANCQYVGGKYQCAPFAKNNDGLIDVCLFHPISIFKFPFIINAYEQGNHLKKPKFSRLYSYCQTKTVKVFSNTEIKACLDGEIISDKLFDISIIPNAISFILPSE